MSKLRAFTMPKWGIEMTEGVVVEWAVSEGERFSQGQVLLAVETDKIANDIEADYDGVCLRLLAEDGDTLDVGELLAVFATEPVDAAEVDAFIAAFEPVASADADDSPPSEPASPAHQGSVDQARPSSYQVPKGVSLSPKALEAAAAAALDLSAVSGSGREGRVLLQDVHQAIAGPAVAAASQPVDNKVELAAFDQINATPIAKRLSVGASFDLAQITGSGRNGRIRAGDLPLNGVADPAAATAAGRRMPFSRMRAKIAERLTRSFREVPHFYLQTDAGIDSLLAARERWNTKASEPASLNDLIVRATALALKAHPQINVHVEADGTVEFDQAHVALAVAVDGGLVTPVVRGADRRSLTSLVAETRRLAAGARGARLGPDDYAGATFTVSNLGMFGVSQFTAIINPPQGAILSVGAGRRMAVEQDDGGVGFSTRMNLTLGCDHRAIDGAMGAAFLATLKQHLEHPQNWCR